MRKAVQQIMLGTVTGSEAAARTTLQRIKAAGYDGLELNRFMIHPSSLMVRLMTRAAGMPTGKGGNLDWKKLMRETDLSVISLHTDLGSLEREPDAVAEEAREYGTDKLVITGMYRFDYGDEKALKGKVDKIVNIIKENNSSQQPVSLEELDEKLTYEHPSYIEAVARLSKQLASFNNQWGLAKWPTVNPKNIRDKIYVVLEENHKPNERTGEGRSSVSVCYGTAG